MTLECVKCRRSPRTSQMPSSGSRQIFQMAQHGALQVPGPTRSPQGRRAAPEQRVHHLAVDVKLRCPCAALPLRTGREFA